MDRSAAIFGTLIHCDSSAKLFIRRGVIYHILGRQHDDCRTELNEVSAKAKVLMKSATRRSSEQAETVPGEEPLEPLKTNQS